jgi:ribosome-binding factor A
MPGRRKQRVASQIRFEIAALLERRIEDPRLRGLSVTGVEISPDLHQAFIYVSALSGQEGSQEALAGLKHASGYFRHELAERLHLRIVPELFFRWDASLETGERISHILDELAKSDDHT